jgi:hypothetical protein
MISTSHRRRNSMLAEQLEAQIRANRLLNLPVAWENELVYPYYDGLSLRNIPHTVAATLHAPLPNPAPLLDTIWQEKTPEAERVIVFLMDGMGYKHLNMLMEADDELRDALAQIGGGRMPVPLTSIAPSTTVVALTSLWTGGTPGETGMVGTLMFLREMSMLGNMLNFGPIVGRHQPDVFADWGLAPEQVVTMPSISQYLEPKGVNTYIYTYKGYLNTGISRIMHRGKDIKIGHSGNTDFMLGLEKLLKETRGKNAYIGVYWGAVDALAHQYGAHHPYTNAEIKRQILALRNVITNPKIQDSKTLFMLLADHGHYDSTTGLELAKDPVISDALSMSAYGDERHTYLQLRHGTMDAVKTRLTDYADKLAFIESSEALDCGYFGKTVSAETRRRIGDLLLLPRLGYVMVDIFMPQYPMVSRHAGLSDWEMLIPFSWQKL